MEKRALVDRWEAGLARAGAAFSQPAVWYAASATLVLLAFLVRLPLVARATDVCCGHPDSWVYFHQAYSNYLSGDVFPDGHRGSGWQLLLAGTLWLFGFEPGGSWTPYGTTMAGDAAQAALVAHALSACLSVGAVAATLLLAREVLPAPAALLAGALVALDPSLLRLSTSAISEPLYVPLFVLALVSVLRARRHPAWLLLTGALMALAHMLKVNGLVMFGMLGVFAWLVFAGDAKEAKGAKWVLGLDGRTFAWGVATVAVFALVAAPYLVWRGGELEGPFDYGTNQRFWADDLWDLDDPWWTAHMAGAPIPRETMGDYAARHSWTDAIGRLWHSIEWQVFDLFGSGRWPAQELEGGQWVGSAPEESALTPLLAGLALVACFTVMKRREWWFLPLAVGFTFLTFLWIYPLVRSVRYFAPLIPLFAVAAVAGWMHLATLVKRPYLVGASVFGAYFVLYAAVPIVHIGEGLVLLAHPRVATLVGVIGALWLLVALAPALPHLVRKLREAVPSRERTPEAP